MDFSCVHIWESSLFSRFLSESDFRTNTCLTFRASLRCFVSWCGENGVSHPDTASLNRWKSYLLSHYRTGTARTYLASVKVFLKWLVHQGYAKDIGGAVRGIQTEREFRKDSLSDGEVVKVLAILEKRFRDAGNPPWRWPAGNRLDREIALRDFVMVLLVTSCGLRISEVSLLDVGDLDMVNGEPVIWIHGKGRDGKTDFVPITTSLQTLLFDYLEKREKASRTFSKKEPMFVSYSQNSRGKRLSSRSISRIAKQAMVAAGLDSPRLTAHSLRHTAVTLALKGGATLQQVQQFARHRLIETTIRYAHNLEGGRTPCSRLVMKLIGRIDYSTIPI